MSGDQTRVFSFEGEEADGRKGLQSKQLIAGFGEVNMYKGKQGSDGGTSKCVSGSWA